jgi:SAM-dependent methyltransferase
MTDTNGDFGLQKLDSWDSEMKAIADHIQALARDDRPLEILEAGCGNRWGLDLKDLNFRLTGVDSNKDALNFRKTQDLTVAILGDLHKVELEKNSFDVIFNSNVLEHINGAEKVLDKFITWLKPGGVLALIFPNRDSVKGFLTRLTPFWFHVWFKRYVQGWKDAGTPGSDPFPTFFDKVVSPSGMTEYCQRRGLHIEGAYYSNNRYTRPAFHAVAMVLTWFLHLLSFGTLSVDKTELVYIIRSPDPPKDRVPSKAESAAVAK